MHLINDWKRKFPKLWSVRLSLLAALMSSVEVALNIYLTGRPPLIVLAAGLISLGAAASRVVAQAELGDE